MMVQRHIDTRALETATVALTKIEQHERSCDERIEQIVAGLAKLETQLALVHGRITGDLKIWLSVSGSMIVVLLAAVGALTMRLF
jgi:hypothetical protein